MKCPSLGKKTNGLDIVAGVDYGVASSLSWSNFPPHSNVDFRDLHVSSTT